MCSGGRLSCAAAAALPHINLLLAAYSGAALATSARLKWDPSAYMPLRELLPAEYRVAAVVLPTLALVLLLLTHLALAATPSRRGLLYSYAALMVALALGETALAVWAWRCAEEWLRSPAAAAAAELQRELTEHLHPLLRALARLYPLPSKLTDLIAEAELDMPRNGYVAGSAAALLLLLQLAGAAAALLLARRSYAGAPRCSPSGRVASAADTRPLRPLAYDCPPLPPRRRARLRP